jgi:equilibrative nucleoside transporter 1/2/3
MLSRDVEFATLVPEGTVSSSSVEAYGRDEQPADETEAYGTCFVLGAGLLFPWNAYISAVDYFTNTYPRSQHVDRAFGVLYFTPNLAMLCCVLRWGDFVSQRTRIRFGYCAFLVCLLAPAVSTNIVVLYVAVALTGASDAICQGSLFAVVGRMPEKFTQALMAGTSFSGLVTSTLRLVTKASFAQTESGTRKGATVYFALSAAWVVACVVLFDRLEKTAIFKQHRKGAQGAQGLQYEKYENGDEHRAPANTAGQSRVSTESQRAEYPGETRGEETQISDGTDGTLHKSQLAFVVRRIRPHAFSVFAVYAVTLSIFPGVLAEDVRDARLGDWFPVLLILVFNLFDVVGKMLPSWLQVASSDLARNPNTLAALSAARVFFVPAFLFVSKRNGFPQNDFSSTACFLLVACLGITNGWYSSVAMMTAPTQFTSKKNKETCGTAMVFFLLSGLALGAACGWAWVRS